MKYSKFIILFILSSTAMFCADNKTAPLVQQNNQNFLDILQTMSGEVPSANTPSNIAIPQNKTNLTQQNNNQDKGCTKIIVDNKTVIYHCGEKTFLKRFGTDGGLFLILFDGKKIKLTE